MVTRCQAPFFSNPQTSQTCWSSVKQKSFRQNCVCEFCNNSKCLHLVLAPNEILCNVVNLRPRLQLHHYSVTAKLINFDCLNTWRYYFGFTEKRLKTATNLWCRTCNSFILEQSLWVIKRVPPMLAGPSKWLLWIVNSSLTTSNIIWIRCYAGASKCQKQHS